jgi:hypothetical protein
MVVRNYPPTALKVAGDITTRTLITHFSGSNYTLNMVAQVISQATISREMSCKNTGLAANAALNLELHVELPTN